MEGAIGMNRRGIIRIASIIALAYVCVTGTLIFQVSTAYSRWESDQVFWNYATLISAEVEKTNTRDFGLSEFERPKLPEYTEPDHRYSIFPWELLREKNEIISSDKLLKEEAISHLEYTNSVLDEQNHRNQ
ncbi:hypothetical protein [Bifidobacterium myosotis]|uniref:Uncharacterized protein n=1 Tax=Bifidobacterium myosotis TaxID=1630166 RepID=A0A5M9ZLT1_9BIFI|nr:hypothetical protein [Bifidobacterium myosotis]KAA8828560.1 hypothetical protein EMO91_05330 [Bifidobacterium myosotis]